MTQQFKGVLEIDEQRGVVYFHHETGRTVLRISGLPTPVPADPTTLLDITHNVGVSWVGQLRASNAMPGTVENLAGLLNDN